MKCYNLSDISPLSKCLQLTELDSAFCSFTDIEPLADHPNFHILRLSGIYANDWSYLERMKSLRELILREPPLRSASELGSVSQVSRLGLVNTQLQSLDGIESFSSIFEPDLSESTVIKDFSPLNDLPSLRELKISAGMAPVAQAALNRGEIQIIVGE
ncbi:MAG: hypothetical protein LBU32_20675 [Clostridiales bacterium]|nr:hypothetical protein [Clostridiales bacterium]